MSEYQAIENAKKFGKALRDSCRAGNIKHVRMAVKQGIPIDARNIDGVTPLHEAARNGHQALVTIMVKELGADVNVRDNQGATPLRYAFINGHHALASYMVSNLRADPNVVDVVSWIDTNVWRDEQNRRMVINENY